MTKEEAAVAARKRQETQMQVLMIGGGVGGVAAVVLWILNAMNQAGRPERRRSPLEGYTPEYPPTEPLA